MQDVSLSWGGRSIDKEIAPELVKKLVLAWDPDYTKLTPDDVATPADLDDIRAAREEYAAGETVGHDAIDWD